MGARRRARPETGTGARWDAWTRARGEGAREYVVDVGVGGVDRRRERRDGGASETVGAGVVVERAELAVYERGRSAGAGGDVSDVGRLGPDVCGRQRREHHRVGYEQN